MLSKLIIQNIFLYTKSLHYKNHYWPNPLMHIMKNVLHTIILISVHEKIIRLPKTLLVSASGRIGQSKASNQSFDQLLSLGKAAKQL